AAELLGQLGDGGGFVGPNLVRHVPPLGAMGLAFSAPQREKPRRRGARGMAQPFPVSPARVVHSWRSLRPGRALVTSGLRVSCGTSVASAQARLRRSQP